MSDATAAETHALFGRVIELDDDARTALLDEECAGRPALRARVEELLAIDAGEDTLLDSDATVFWQLLLEDGEPPPDEIGAYRIVRELGRGGMGVVYLAERTNPEFQQQVALKIIGPRPDASALAERFRRERQILANLRHPNIAQLYDGGLTPVGLPFLAMEYVEGERIDRWCDARRLSVDERVRLFLTVCAAVAHVQKNLVVHRDLKPANILVTPDGVVKLLDFGIAKLVPEESGAPDSTQTGLHVFTPRYASPEQIRHAGATAATDVYALGVILFELLTGTAPFPETTDAFEAARAVLESDPPAPSHAAAAPAPDPSARAAARSTSVDRLRHQLRGDLDAIVSKAMRRDPAERYANAAALRDDLMRVLAFQPVRARPDGARYRLRKFVRRRRAAVAVSLSFAFLTASFAAIYTTYTRPAEAGQNLVAYDHLLRGDNYLRLRTPDDVRRAIGEYESAMAADPASATPLFRVAYASLVYADWSWPHPDLTAPELLSRARLLVDRGLDMDPGSAEGWLTRGYLQVLLDPFRMTGALPSFERSLALDDDNVEGWHQYGQTLMALGRFADAAAAYERALRIDPRRSMTLVPLAAIALYTGRLDEALTWADSAVAVAPANSYARAGLARVLMVRGNVTRARTEAELAAGVDHGHAVPVLATLAIALARDRALEEARSVFDEALEIAGPDSLSVLDAPNLAAAADALGDAELAITLLGRARMRGAWYWFYLQTPLLAGLRTDPRFQRLMNAADPSRRSS